MSFFSPEVRRNPYPLYAQMRERAPVLRDPASGLWMAFDYESVRRLLTDHDTFSSAASPPGSLTSHWLIFTDPPRHTRLRSLIMRAFTPRAVAQLEERIVQIVDELLDDVRGRASLDFVRDFAIPLPLMVIAEMLGAPPEEFPRFREWSDAILALTHTVSGDARASATIERVRAVNEEMRRFVTPLIATRRAAPDEDLLSRLANAEAEGSRLTEDEILAFFQLLLVAGHETTTNLLSNAMLLLAEHRDQLALLRVVPDLIETAVEEVVRFRSPVQAAFRIARTPTELRGQAVPAGAMVLAMLGSANRDRAHIEHPDRFDVSRQPNPHVGFGHGIHYCIGAPLARLEGRIALRRLLDRWSDFDVVDADAWQPREAFHVHGPSSLEIRFTERS